MATEKQYRYIMYLLNKCGYSTRYMNSSFKELGATMRERSGSVKDWVLNKNVGEASDLISILKKKGCG